MAKMVMAKAEASAKMKSVTEQLQAQARIDNAKFIDEFLGVADLAEADVEETPVEVKKITNEILTTLQFTSVRIAGHFYKDQAKYEQEPENICGCWELAEVTIKDMESDMKCILEIRPDNEVFVKCLDKLDAIIKSAEDSSPLWEQNMDNRRILHEKEFLSLLVPYLSIFIAREKKILIVKIKNTTT